MSLTWICLRAELQRSIAVWNDWVSAQKERTEAHPKPNFHDERARAGSTNMDSKVQEPRNSKTKPHSSHVGAVLFCSVGDVSKWRRLGMDTCEKARDLYS